MICSDCGTTVEDTDIFCPNCGIQLGKPQYAKQGKVPYEGLIYRGGEVPPEPMDDTLPWYHYFLTFLFFPVGIWIWAYYRDERSKASRRILYVTVIGFIFWIILLG